MGAAARHSATPASGGSHATRADVPVPAPRVSQARRRAARRARLMRALVVFVACLAMLSVGRVALSFAVVQKTLHTEAVVSEQRRLSARNDELREEVAQLSSTVRISRIAESELGLVVAQHIDFPQPVRTRVLAEATSDH